MEAKELSVFFFNSFFRSFQVAAPEPRGPPRVPPLGRLIAEADRAHRQVPPRKRFFTARFQGSTWTTVDRQNGHAGKHTGSMMT